MNPSELALVLDSGVAMLGVSADANLASEIFRVWGATLDDEGRVRALASSDAVRTFDHLRDGAPVSFVFTDITTFQSVQVKGRTVGALAAPGPAETAVMRRYDAAFGAALAHIGHPPALRESLRPMSVFVITMTIDQLYDQTPGAGAGRPSEQGNRG
jgi:hypothetical protein